MSYDIYTGMLKMGEEFQRGTKEIDFQYGYDQEITKILNDKYKIKDVAGNGNHLSKAIHLLDWLTTHTYHRGDYDGHITNNAIDLLNFTYNTGAEGAINCRSLSIVLTECCLALGLHARTMYLLPFSPYDADNHVVTEVYIPEKEKWIMLDPSYNAYIMDDTLEVLSVLEIRQALADRQKIKFNDRINYNGDYNLDLEDIQAYYAKDMFWIQCREKQDYNSEQLHNRIISFAPIGYDIKKSRIANIDYRISMYGDNEWMQEWKEAIINDNVIYMGLEKLKACPIEIKQITQNDYEFLYVLMNDSSIMEALNEAATSMENWKNAIIHWENDEDEENYIIYNNHIPIGWIGINNLISSDQEAFIKILAILPENQTNGIGAYAVKYIIDYLRNKGFKKISLYTDKENINAQKCYTKCGFKVEHTLIDTMSNGNTVERYKMGTLL